MLEEWSRKPRRDKTIDVVTVAVMALLVGFAVFYAVGYQWFIDQPRVLPLRAP